MDAPFFHHQWLPDQLYVNSSGFPNELVTALREKGHTVAVGGRWSDAQAVMIDPATGDRLGAGESRGAARPVGY